MKKKDSRRLWPNGRISLKVPKGQPGGSYRRKAGGAYRRCVTAPGACIGAYRAYKTMWRQKGCLNLCLSYRARNIFWPRTG